MLRRLYFSNFLMVKSFWHLINKFLLSNTARSKALLKWERLVRAFYNCLGKTYFVSKRNGMRYLLDMNNLIDLRIAARGAYEAEQKSYFLSQIKSKQCTLFFDIGTNWGMYTLPIATLSQIIAVHSFEPDEKNRSQLYANIFLNQLHHKISIYDCAISSFTGEANFSSTKNDSGKLQNRGISKLSTEGNDSVIVKKFDDIIAIKNEKIALKIDIEGNELEAIAGMQKCLKENECLLQIEAFKDTKDKLMLTMENSGYKLIHFIGNDYYFSNF